MKNYILLVGVALVLMVAIPLVAFIGNNDARPINNQPMLNDYFKILDVKTGEILTVSAKDYMCGALATEISPAFHSEALKAQAVAAYTYSVYLREQQIDNPSQELKGAHFAADPSSFSGYATKEAAKEKWGKNFNSHWKKITDAVDEVYGKIAVFEGKPIFAAYHAISAGVTEYASVVWGEGPDYLIPVKSDGDLLSPDYQTTVTFSKEDFFKKIKEVLPGIELATEHDKWLGEITRSASGTVLSVEVGGQSLTGHQIRSLFSLRSLNFDISVDNESFIFTVKGAGHNVGLSQYGADYMARQGSSYEQILKHYYTGIDIADIDDIQLKFNAGDITSSYEDESLMS